MAVEPTYVYVMQMGRFCKIGISHDVVKRRKTVHTPYRRGQYRARKTIVGSWYCGRFAREIEAVIKAAFAAHAVKHAGHEWFRLSPDALMPLLLKSIRYCSR